MQSQQLTVLFLSLTLGVCLAQLATCPNEVPTECPVNSTVTTGCATCCCASSDNVEFYVPSEGEPNCTAPAAVYEVRFEATWTASCHPDYYFSSAHWSPLTGISHKPEYELWDACMYDVSLGVALVSQTGGTIVIFQEYSLNAAYVLDSFKTPILFRGAGTLSTEMNFDSDHQYVSVVTMLAPSADRMMGVSSLRLCNGSKWKDSVKLCGELFSTATRSDRVSDGRNSIQFNNCSFGYFMFTLQSVEEPIPSLTAHPSKTVIPVSASVQSVEEPVPSLTAHPSKTMIPVSKSEVLVPSSTTPSSKTTIPVSVSLETPAPSSSADTETSPSNAQHLTGSRFHSAFCLMALILIMKLVL